jgi:rhodanese-related sulfurtransferase
MTRITAVLVALLALLVPGLAGCSQDSPPADSSAYTAIIDVRTPAEFSSGHVEGAVNYDVQSPQFAAQIATLDADGEYLVYCRSGNRSQAAAAQMEAAGLTVTDGGGLDEMKSAGWTFTG